MPVLAACSPGRSRRVTFPSAPENRGNGGRRDIAAVAHLAQGRVADAELGGVRDSGRVHASSNSAVQQIVHVKARSKRMGDHQTPSGSRRAIVPVLFSTHQSNYTRDKAGRPGLRFARQAAARGHPCSDSRGGGSPARPSGRRDRSNLRGRGGCGGSSGGGAGLRAFHASRATIPF